MEKMEYSDKKDKVDNEPDEKTEYLLQDTSIFLGYISLRDKDNHLLHHQLLVLIWSKVENKVRLATNYVQSFNLKVQHVNRIR